MHTRLRAEAAEEQGNNIASEGRADRRAGPKELHCGSAPAQVRQMPR